MLGFGNLADVLPFMLNETLLFARLLCLWASICVAAFGLVCYCVGAYTYTALFCPFSRTYWGGPEGHGTEGSSLSRWRSPVCSVHSLECTLISSPVFPSICLMLLLLTMIYTL